MHLRDGFHVEEDQRSICNMALKALHWWQFLTLYPKVPLDHSAKNIIAESEQSIIGLEPLLC